MNREHAMQIVKALPQSTREAIVQLIETAEIKSKYDDECAECPDDAYQTLSNLAAEIRGEGNE